MSKPSTSWQLALADIAELDGRLQPELVLAGTASVAASSANSP